jgi:hypothetical protein
MAGDDRGCVANSDRLVPLPWRQPREGSTSFSDRSRVVSPLGKPAPEGILA